MLSESQHSLMLKVMDEMRFMQGLKDFTDNDKLDIFRCFKLERLVPGQRVFGQSDKIDFFAVILKGKVGIYYPDHLKVKLAQQT